MLKKVLFVSLCILLKVLFFIGCKQYREPEVPESIQQIERLVIYPADLSHTSRIQLTREQVFRGTTEVFFAAINNINVDAKQHVYITDSAQHAIFVFAPDGQYVQTLGREGSGPGEFRLISTTDIVEEHMYVYDFSLRRISVFNLESYVLSHTINLGSVDRLKSDDPIGVYSPRRMFIRENNNMLLELSPLMQTPPSSPGQKIDNLYREYYPVNTDGSILHDKIYEQKDLIWLTAEFEGRIQLTTNLPFLGKSLIYFSKNGFIYSAWSKDFLIEVRDPSGEYQYAFYYPIERVDLSSKDALHSVSLDFRRRVIQQNVLPETWPALYDLLIDDENRLWVSTIVEDFDIYEWWVLEETGELITRFEWARDEPIEVVKNGYMYTRETDEETGLQQIVRYRIEMGGI